MAVKNNYRQLIILTGEQESTQAYAKALTKNLDCLNLDDNETASQYLGAEFDAVIFNTFKHFDANALGIVTGTIRARGYLIIIKPASWQSDSLFLNRFNKLLSQDDATQFFDISTGASALAALPASEKFGKYASNDQQQAVAAIIKVVKGHRRRPLLISADRGRGKSAALGIASAQLCKDGLQNIIVTAKSKKMAEVIFQQARQNNPQARITFYAPDELLQKKPEAELVLVDEAGAIPLPLLEAFVKQYSRIVFATTLHGYEGSGRGFTHKFFKTLDSVAAGWRHYPLHSPVRYPANDPLENFIFKALLLNAEPVSPELIKHTRLADCHVELLEKQKLIKDETLLKNIFALLVTAHYQTRPSDLKRLLDDNMLRVYVLFTAKKLPVAVALMIKEGGIEPDLASQIFQGKRRIPGHLVAQALAANAGIEFAPCLRGERVSRIAVHPCLQNKGFGSSLLKTVCEKSTADYISTSYGVTHELIHFWNKLGFKAVYLGIKRDASSGTHSLMMLKDQSDKGKELLKDAQSGFAKNYIQLLAEPFKNLDSELALSILAQLKIEKSFEINEQDKQALAAFAHHQRGYENTLYPIWALTIRALSTDNSLSCNEKKVLMLKVLQKQGWKECRDLLELNGKKEVLQLLRQAIARLLKT